MWNFWTNDYESYTDVLGSAVNEFYFVLVTQSVVSENDFNSHEIFQFSPLQLHIKPTFPFYSTKKTQVP